MIKYYKRVDTMGNFSAVLSIIIFSQKRIFSLHNGSLKGLLPEYKAAQKCRIFT